MRVRTVRNKGNPLIKVKYGEGARAGEILFYLSNSCSCSMDSINSLLIASMRDA
jgi:hypothetical protein